MIFTGYGLGLNLGSQKENRQPKSRFVSFLSSRGNIHRTVTFEVPSLSTGPMYSVQSTVKEDKQIIISILKPPRYSHKNHRVE